MLPISRKGDGLKRAMFLCEDNFLLSRFCEELFNSLIRDEGLNWQAISRAVSPAAARRPLQPMSAAAVSRLRAIGVAPVNHRRLPLGVNEFDFMTCHAVFAIDEAATRAELARFGKELTAPLEFWAVDPAASAEARLDRLAAAVIGLLDRISGREPASAALVPVALPAGPAALVPAALPAGPAAGSRMASAKLAPAAQGKRSTPCQLSDKRQALSREIA